MIFNLAGDHWLDPSTSRVMFQLNNAGNVGAADGTAVKALETLPWNPAVSFVGRELFTVELLSKTLVTLLRATSGIRFKYFRVETLEAS